MLLKPILIQIIETAKKQYKKETKYTVLQRLFLNYSRKIWNYIMANEKNIVNKILLTRYICIIFKMIIRKSYCSRYKNLSQNIRINP